MNIILFILFLLLLIVFIGYISLSAQRDAYRRQYHQVLTQFEGAKILVYNNKQAILEYVENEVLPKLSTDIQAVFLNGRTPVSDLPLEAISSIIHAIPVRGGFPYLVRIQKQSLCAMSIGGLYIMRSGRRRTYHHLS
jgi:hypothetical protein